MSGHDVDLRLQAAADPALALAPSGAATEACARFARRIQRLYSLPTAALRVVRLTSGADTDVRALTECLETDPALCSRILAVVNSSVFGLREKVYDLGQAVTLLGIKPLKLLVIGLSLPRDLLRVEDAEVLRSYWRHALVKSVAAREISRQFFQQRCEDEAFIAGLLQDVGLLALVQQLSEPFVRLLGLVQHHRADLIAAEREALGFDHVELSAELLRHWGLPEPLVRFVRVQQPPLAGPTTTPAQLVPRILWMAELCARILSGRPEALVPLHAAGKACRLEESQLGRLLYELESKVHPLAQAMAVDTRDWPQLRGLVDLAYAALAEATEQVDRQQIDRRALQAVTDQSRRLGDDVSVTAPAAVPPASGRPEPAAASKPGGAPADGAQPLGKAITAAAAWCRAQRRPLSLLLIAWAESHDAEDHSGQADLCSGLRPFLAEIVDQRFTPLALDGNTLALVIRDCSRQQALEIARQLLDHAALGVLRHGLALGVASLAMTLRNFAAADLETAARRCLFAARQSGGGMVKSIDLI